MTEALERKTSKLRVELDDSTLRIEGERGALNALVNVLFRALKDGSGAARSSGGELTDIIVHRIDP